MEFSVFEINIIMHFMKKACLNELLKIFLTFIMVKF